MIVDNLTKFNQKKKLWMTPKHVAATIFGSLACR